jgi:hypothetical protein
MNNQDKEANNQQVTIEDLTVNQDQAAELKGGPVDHTIPVFFHVIRAK